MQTQKYKECSIAPVISLSSLYTFSTQTFAENHRFIGESHSFYEVVFVVKGKVGVTADKNIHFLSAGQMIIHPSGEFHAIWSDCGTSPQIIVFSFQATTFPLLKRYVFTLPPEQISEIKQIYFSAQRAFVLNGHNVEKIRPRAEYSAALVVRQLESFLLRAFASDEEVKTAYTSRTTENYALILSVMEEHIHEPLSAQELAELCSMSIPTMERTVFRFAHCGTINYFHGLKQQRATQMLQLGASVKEVALSLGFSNQNYFSLWYKKRTGKAPSQI